MKKIFLFYSTLFFMLSYVSFGQQLSLDEIRNYYKSFNYQKVIELSEILLNENTLTGDETIDLQTMKAVSHYSLNDEQSARKSFIEILKLDKNYSLDPAFISPKIIALFENTKKDFNQIYEEKPEEPGEQNKPEEQQLKKTERYTVDNSYLLKSIVLPGWGHLSRNGSAKGWLITTASLASLGSMIYYIVDANDKEKKYLNEKDPFLIQQKYDSFNKSYKTRNALIAAYAAVWLFAQLDLIVFDAGYEPSPINISTGSGQPNDISLSIKLGL